MAILMQDTDLEAERFLVRLWAQNTPLDQCGRLLHLWEFAKQLKGASSVSMTPMEVTLTVMAALEKVGAIYCVGGSVASSLFGEARFTQDTDMLVQLDANQLAGLLEAVKEEFYVSETRCLNLIHFSSQHKIDIFVSPERPFERSRLARSRVPEGFSSLFLVSTPEDTVVAKLEWFQLSSSERQWRDILSVLVSQRERLDFDYLERWTQELQVSDL